MSTTAGKIISFYNSLSFDAPLPPGIRAMNPVAENKDIKKIMSMFYKKFYNDHEKRVCMIGINPGRFGGGLTGIPFTDPKRLQDDCGIPYSGAAGHEPSSAFIYEMIRAYGGPEQFYNKVYITAVSPLGFTTAKENGREVNFNYYDTPALQQAVTPFATACMKKQLPFLKRDTCICIGTGKNEHFIRRWNEANGFFKNIVSVEHPRFVMQYKSKEKEKYIAKYLDAVNNI